MVFEILSPSTAKLDLWQKRRDYAWAGVREYWLVDPETARIEIIELKGDRFELHSAAEGTGTVESRVIPDFTIDLARLFAGLK